MLSLVVQIGVLAGCRGEQGHDFLGTITDFFGTMSDFLGTVTCAAFVLKKEIQVALQSWVEWVECSCKGLVMTSFRHKYCCPQIWKLCDFLEDSVDSCDDNCLMYGICGVTDCSSSSAMVRVFVVIMYYALTPT